MHIDSSKNIHFVRYHKIRYDQFRVQSVVMFTPPPPHAHVRVWCFDLGHAKRTDNTKRRDGTRIIIIKNVVNCSGKEDGGA